MTEFQIALCALFSIESIGILLIFVGFLVGWITKRRSESCTMQTNGTVTRYLFMGGGNMSPVVEYQVDGIIYTTRKKYNAIKSVSITGLPNTIQADVWEDDKGYLCIKRGSFVNYKDIASQLWPLGHQMRVYYNPDRPKINYVERPITNRFITIIYVIAGCACIGVGILTFFLIQL